MSTDTPHPPEPCQSTFNGVQCVVQAGHGGNHEAPGAAWPRNRTPAARPDLATRCHAKRPDLVHAGLTRRCSLPPGHTDDHRSDGDGNVPTLTWPQEVALSAYRCPATCPWRCALVAGHAGPHVGFNAEHVADNEAAPAGPTVGTVAGTLDALAADPDLTQDQIDDLAHAAQTMRYLERTLAAAEAQRDRFMALAADVVRATGGAPSCSVDRLADEAGMALAALARVAAEASAAFPEPEFTAEPLPPTVKAAAAVMVAVDAYSRALTGEPTTLATLGTDLEVLAADTAAVRRTLA